MGIGELKPFAEKVAEAFAEFIAAHSSLKAKQIQFLNALQTFIIENGALSKRDLTREPFTLIHAKGILGLFKPKEREEILSLATSLLSHA